MTILIVDDTPAHAQIAGSILKDLGTVVTTHSGAKALELTSRYAFDLVLLDVHMPVMDGFEVCRRLQADPATRGIPVVFVTAQRDEISEAHGLNLGALDYIAKPLQPSVLRARVSNQLALRRQRQKLERLSRHDDLTGIANRRAWDEGLKREWSRMQRLGEPMGLLMIDVDHFKRYNDTYGHPAGDQCLYRVAQAIQGAQLRDGDLVARYGGEEFACLLPHTDLQSTVAVARRIHQAVRDMALPHASSSGQAHVSVSIGAASATPRMRQSPQTLVTTADQRLYLAKAQGRNCVVGEDAESEKPER